jgi:hypothetical protein
LPWLCHSRARPGLMAKADSSLKPQVTMARRELDLALGKSAVSQAAIDELKAEAATLDARKT